MRFFLLVCVLFVGNSAFGQQVCRNGNCPTRTQAYTSYVPVHGSTATAQGVAEMQAARGHMGHFGNPAGGYEGVGMGSTPEAALNNCCLSRSGRVVVDQGVALGRNGRWYACKRYR